MIDVLIQNGTVIDPAEGLHGSYDLAIHEGKILKISPQGSMDATQATATIDVKGRFVVPGLIDIHTHVFPGATYLGIEADRVGVCQGVTTVVDAGSTGVNDFDKFIRDVVTKSSTQILAWINIAGDGLCQGRAELSDLANVEIDRTVELIRQYPLIRGIKVRMSSSVLGTSGIKPLLKAKEAAEKARVPLMVHIGNGPPGLGDILALLGKGDIVTHAFHGKRGGILNEEGELIPEAQSALARGVLFDVGHGTSSFSFSTMDRAKRAGVKPYTISTDIYRENYQGPVGSLAATLSKFLALGYSLDEVVALATANPANALGLSGSHGSLAIGRRADVTILNLAEGSFDFVDAEGSHLAGRQLLHPQCTIRAGKVLTCK